MLQSSAVSIGPISTPLTDVTPRPKRQPRKLDYLKCSSCRKAKVKCVPRHGAQVAEGCTRCVEKNLACSGLQRKTAIDVRPLSSDRDQVLNTDDGHANDELDERDALVLLSLFHVFDLAIRELIVVGQKQLSCISPAGYPAWKEHARQLENILNSYYDFSAELAEKIIFSNVPSTIIANLMDLKYPVRSMGRTSSIIDSQSTIDAAHDNGHFGIAYLLQMRQLEQNRDPSEGTVSDFLQSRENFISMIAPVLERHEVSSVLDTLHCQLELTETNLFVPKALLKIPTLAKAIREDDRSDLLGRHARHLGHDANITQVLESSDAALDEHDVLGRSILHLACSTSRQKCTKSAWDLISTAWPGRKMLGLNALHLAAIKGNIGIFRTAAARGVRSFVDPDVHRSSGTEWSYLHWAARHGHSELTQFLLEEFEHEAKILFESEHKDCTAIEIATENGHVHVVRTILSHIRAGGYVWEPFTFGRRAFFSAITRGRSDIVELLGPFMHPMNVDGVYTNLYGKVLTPLAEAARRGSSRSVDYLLKHGSVNPNSVSWSDQKTPLDRAIAGRHYRCVELLQRSGALTSAELLGNKAGKFGMLDFSASPDWHELDLDAQHYSGGDSE